MALPIRQGATDYGTDVSTLGGLDPRGATVSGPLNVAQAIVHRLMCAPGSIKLRPKYRSMDIRQLVGKAFPINNNAGEQALASQIADLIEEDERIESVTCLVAMDIPNSTIAITINVALATGQVFTAILEVNKVSVTLLSLTLT